MFVEKIVLGATGTPNTPVFEHLLFSFKIFTGTLSHLPGQREVPPASITPDGNSVGILINIPER